MQTNTGASRPLLMIELLDSTNIHVQNSGVKERNKAINITSLHCPGSEQVEKKIKQ